MSDPPPTGDHVRANRAAWNEDSDDYQRRHAAQLDTDGPAWGAWSLPEDELRILGDVAGKDVLELGCGAAQWAERLVRRGARCVGCDLSERQLAHAHRRLGAGVPLVQADAEHAPFRAGSFDVVFCDHGAMSFADPYRTVPEVARLLRPGGLFAFNVSSPLKELLWDERRSTDTRLVQRVYFDLHASEDEGETTFNLPYGAWIRLFREHGLRVEDLVELRPPRGAVTSYDGYVRHSEARNHCLENVWVLRREDAGPRVGETPG